MKSLISPMHGLALLCAVLISFCFTSCDVVTSDAGAFAITEVMPKNVTGLMANDGELYDWIEVTNTSDQAANLRGLVLAKDSCNKTWQFPDSVVAPGQSVLVFATKRELHGQLSCGFGLKSKGETLQLLSSGGQVVSEVTYDKLKADQSLRLTKKGKLKKTYHVTPGMPNTDEAFWQYEQMLESQRKSPLKLSEYLRHPLYATVGGKARAWVELQNVSNDSVLLSDYTLASKVDDSLSIELPQQMLAPGEYFYIADAGKRLKGQTVVLMRDGKFQDGLNARKAYYGISVGRCQGSDGQFYFDAPTPGEPNTGSSYRDITKKPKYIVWPGVYEQNSLVIKLDTDGAEVHYTLDGTRPTIDSPVYHDSILIDKTTTLRAFAVDSLSLRSEYIYGTYMLGTSHTLPVVFVTMSEADLYDQSRGIYARGSGASSEFPYLGANFWKNWEKPAHVQFCDGESGFSSDCNIKIFGGFSRGRDKKSFQIKFNPEHGMSKLKYDLFGRGEKQEYKSFVLRSGSQDDIGVMVRDEFFTSLLSAESPTLLVQDYCPVVLCINNDYFGIYYIREKINKDFVGRHLKAEPDSTQLLMQQHNRLYGSSVDYCQMVNYAISHDMKDSIHFNHLKELVDFESLIDFKLGEFYASNTDVGNIRYCRTTDPRGIQKWHWIYYDLDATFLCMKDLEFYIRGNSLNAPISSTSSYNVLINRLLTNPSFRELFLQRWAYHRSHTFEPKHAQKVFDALIQTIRPEMERNCKRWPNLSYERWEQHVKQFRQQLETRLPLLHDNLLHELNVTKSEQKRYFKD